MREEKSQKRYKKHFIITYYIIYNTNKTKLQLAQKLKPQSIGGTAQTLISPVTAQLATHNRHFTLNTPTLPEMAALAPHTVGTVWGAPHLDTVLNSLVLFFYNFSFFIFFIFYFNHLFIVFILVIDY